MTSTNDGKDVKSNQTSGPKGKSYYIELYKFLEARLSEGGDAHERTTHLCAAWRSVHSLCQHSAPSTHTHLINWLQRHTARAVLQTEWQTPKRKDDRKILEEAIDVFVGQVAESSKDGESHSWESQLVARGEWFKQILDKPWGHPVLTLLLNPNGTPPTDDEVLAWLIEERGVTFVVRLHTLVGEKCDDIAVSLATAVMERARAALPAVVDSEEQTGAPVVNAPPTFADKLKEEAGFTLDVWETITDIEFVLLHKRDINKCIALAKQTPLLDAYPLIERLQKRLEISPREKRLWKNAREVAILIAQVVIARCMVVKSCYGAARTALYCCVRILARLLTSSLPGAADALAAQALTARHLHTLAQAVDKQLSPTNEEMKPYVCELYVRAITAGMNELERFKLKTEKDADARSMEKTLASWFVQLGTVLAKSDRIACECTLTAFSLHPSQKMYERIDAAPPLAPVIADSTESKEETVNSEFGSWASDSRSQTNLVKTSETLKMKQTQNQANVLSSAIFNEGEALGLSPELCQDIAVLLSGPRVKTLSWDMDRTLLLDNCRAYCEVTQEGTRAMTRELKYLNIDPQQYQHLPEEKDDDENDPYYGIERGYEHLAVLDEPEEIWEDANDLEETESSSSIEKHYLAPRRKKKTKKVLHSSDEDSDPLSFVAESKRTQKKKERPHSKERSKERKKKQELVDPLAIDGSSQNQSQTKPKKEPKEKKERKKKEKVPKVIGGKRSSLSSLVGIKVGNTKKKPKALSAVGIPINDGVYESSDKYSLTSLNSEGKSSDAIYENTLHAAERKNAEAKERLDPKPFAGTMKNQYRAYQMFGNKCGTTHMPGRPPNNLSKMQYKPQIPNTVRQPSPSDFTTMINNYKKYPDDVRANLSRLLEFRRQRDELKLVQQNKNPQMPFRKPAIIRPDIPLQANISPKSVAIPEIPKSYINKEQAERMVEFIRTQTKPCLKDSVIQYAKKRNLEKSKTDLNKPTSSSASNRAQNYTSTMKMSDFINPSYDRLMAEIAERQSRGQEATKPAHSQRLVQNTPRQIEKSLNTLTPGQRDFQNFLKDYESNKYSPTTHAIDMSAKSSREVKKSAMPISRVIPVLPNVPKPESKPQQCLKQPIHQRKPDASLNTFSRLSYHKNKQNEMKNKFQPVKPACTTVTYQEVSSELDEIIKEHQLAQMKVLQSKRDIVERLPKPCQEPMNKCHPLLTNLLQSPTPKTSSPFCRDESLIKASPMQYVPAPLKSSLSEKDNNDLLNLLRQQNKLNNYPQSYQTNINSKPSPSSSTSTVGKSPPVTNYNPNSIQSQQQPSRPPNHNAKENVSSLESKIINVISNTLLKPGSHEINKCLNVKLHPNAPTTKPVNCTVTQATVKKNVTCKDQVEKKYIPESSKPEWQAVMCDLLRHKTPTRGPNALDVALNKSSFELAFEKSVKEASTLSQPVVEKDVTIKQYRKADRPKPVITSIQNVIITKKGIKLQNEDMKGHKDYPVDTKTYSKHHAIVINEKLKSRNTTETTKKFHQEVQRKQFMYSGPKNNDPFISGIPNSDYDLLEELMDDDLRKEIGEISSDDESYNTAAQSFLKPSKNSEKRVSVQFNKSLNESASNLAPRQQYLKDRQSKNTTLQATSTVSQSTNKIRTPNESNALKVHQKLANTENGNPVMAAATQSISIQTSMTPKVQNRTCNNVTFTNSQIMIEPNVYISAVPQPAPLQNVVLVGQELVYGGFTNVQAPVQTIRNIVPNTYVTVNNTPTMTLYQTTQYNTPMVIGASISVPVINNITCPAIPVQSGVINNQLEPSCITVMKTSALHPQIVDSQVTIKTCDTQTKIISQDEANDSSQQNHKLQDENKAIERKVLCEVQEFVTTENIDNMRTQKIENNMTVNIKKDIVANLDRVKKKRLAIVNREIYHRCGEDIIPLEYSPLPRKIKTDTEKHDISEAVPLAYASLSPKEDKQKLSDIEEEKLLAQIKNDLQDLSNAINEVSSPATPDSNDSKENKSYAAVPCRRILLRSSNKIIPKSNAEDTPILKKSKAKLKSETSDAVAAPSVIVQVKTNEKEFGTSKRASKRLRNKKITVITEEKKPLQQRQKPDPKTKHLSENKNKSELVKRNIAESLEFFDIESELQGSRISKVVLENKHNLENNHSNAENYVVDTAIVADKADENTTIKTSMQHKTEFPKISEKSAAFADKHNEDIVSEISEDKEISFAEQFYQKTSVPEDKENKDINPENYPEQNTTVPVNKENKYLIPEMSISHVSRSEQFSHKIPTLVEKINEDIILEASVHQKLIISEELSQKNDMHANEHIASVPQKTEHLTQSSQDKIDNQCIPKPNKDIKMKENDTPESTEVKTNVNSTSEHTSKVFSETKENIDEHLDSKSKVKNVFARIPKPSCNEFEENLTNDNKTKLLLDAKVSAEVHSAPDSFIKLITTNGDVERLAENYSSSNKTTTDQNKIDILEKDNIDLDMTVTCEELPKRRLSPVFENIKTARSKPITDKKDVKDCKDIILNKEIETGSNNEKNGPSVDVLHDIEMVKTLKPQIQSNNIELTSESCLEIKTQISPKSEVSNKQHSATDMDDDVVIIDDNTNTKHVVPLAVYGNGVSAKKHVNKATILNINMDPPVKNSVIRCVDDETSVKDHKEESASSNALSHIIDYEAQSETNGVVNPELNNVEKLPEMPQHFKDNIHIENLPSKDPTKTRVRISLPNGRKVIATVSNKVHVTYDTLFAHPLIKDAILNEMNCKKSYVMKIMQIVTVDKTDPNKILSAQLNNVETSQRDITDSAPSAVSIKPVEIIDLLSDDDDSDFTLAKNTKKQEFVTEYGNFNTPLMSKDLFKKHQEKFSQKTQILLKKVDEKPHTQVNNVEAKPSSPQNIALSDITPLIPNQYVIGLVNDIKDKLASKVNNTPRVTPEVVEIDDSSNDSLYQGKSTVIRKEEKTIDELKDVLLKELGVKVLTQASANKLQEIPSHVDNVDIVEKMQLPQNSNRRKMLKLSTLPKGESCPFMDLDEEEQVQITKRKCVVKLIRCDDLPKKFKRNSVATTLPSPILDYEPIAIREDFTIFNDLDEKIVEEERSSSPVIELFDVLVSLQEKMLACCTSTAHHTIPISCVANWHSTKSTLHSACVNNAPKVTVFENDTNISHDNLIDKVIPLVFDANWLTTKYALHVQDFNKHGVQYYNSQNDRNICDTSVIDKATPLFCTSIRSTKPMQNFNRITQEQSYVFKNHINVCDSNTINKEGLLSCKANWLATKSMLHIQEVNEETLAQSNSSECDEMCNGNLSDKALIALFCKANWLTTKSMLHLQSVDEKTLTQSKHPQNENEMNDESLRNQVIPLSCESNWLMSKPMLHLQSFNEMALIQSYVHEQAKICNDSPHKNIPLFCLANWLTTKSTQYLQSVNGIILSNITEQPSNRVLVHNVTPLSCEASWFTTKTSLHLKAACSALLLRSNISTDGKDERPSRCSTSSLSKVTKTMALQTLHPPSAPSLVSVVLQSFRNTNIIQQYSWLSKASPVNLLKRKSLSPQNSAACKINRLNQKPETKLINCNQPTTVVIETSVSILENISGHNLHDTKKDCLFVNISENKIPKSLVQSTKCYDNHTVNVSAVVAEEQGFEADGFGNKAKATNTNIGRVSKLSESSSILHEERDIKVRISSEYRPPSAVIDTTRLIALENNISTAFEKNSGHDSRPPSPVIPVKKLSHSIECNSCYDITEPRTVTENVKDQQENNGIDGNIHISSEVEKSRKDALEFQRSILSSTYKIEAHPSENMNTSNFDEIEIKLTGIHGEPMINENTTNSQSNDEVKMSDNKKSKIIRIILEDEPFVETDSKKANIYVSHDDQNDLFQNMEIPVNKCVKVKDHEYFASFDAVSVVESIDDETSNGNYEEMYVLTDDVIFLSENESTTELEEEVVDMCNDEIVDDFLHVTTTDVHFGENDSKKQFDHLSGLISLEKDSTTNKICINPVTIKQDDITIHKEKDKECLETTKDLIENCVAATKNSDKMDENPWKLSNDINAESIMNKYLALIRNKSEVLESVVEYEDPEAGTCYVIPIIQESSNTSIESIENAEVTSIIENPTNKKVKPANTGNSHQHNTSPSSTVVNEHGHLSYDDIEPNLTEMIGESVPEKTITHLLSHRNQLDDKYKTVNTSRNAVPNPQKCIEDVACQLKQTNKDKTTSHKALGTKSVSSASKTRQSKYLYKVEHDNIIMNTRNMKVILPKLPATISSQLSKRQSLKRKIDMSNTKTCERKYQKGNQAKLAEVVGESFTQNEITHNVRFDDKYKTSYTVEVESISNTEKNAEDISQFIEIDHDCQKSLLESERISCVRKRRQSKHSNKSEDVNWIASTETLKVTLPKHTYSKADEQAKTRRRSYKRTIDVSDTKTSEKKYRKGKNIDYPRFTAASLSETVYAKEYKTLIDYCSSIKFSFAVPFHKEEINVYDNLKSWPIKNTNCERNQIKHSVDANPTLFTEIEKSEALLDPLAQTLPEEIISNFDENSYTPSNIHETNFNMGFGERSGRVIQKSKDGETTFSAATLSDVKQLQPLLPSDKNKMLVEFNCLDNNGHNQQLKKKGFVDHLRLKEKVRSFFEKTKVELSLDYKRNYKKDDSDSSDWPFGDLTSTRCFEPSPVQVTVNVVQVGQLPVNSAAQNPVTCDPRVTHVSNASPSQCSPENSLGDELQPPIKTEYTELTTADITLPLMQEYVQHHSLPSKSQEHANLYNANDSTTQIKSIVKIELMEEITPGNEEEIVEYENNGLQELPNGNISNSVQYQFENITNNIATESESIAAANSSNTPKTILKFTEDNLSNITVEKPDQLAHAMNAAGISAIKGLAKINDSVDTIQESAQNVSQSPTNTTTFSKTSPINAIALQQALAQILPPPHNQAINTNENNLQTSANPQVLHIVQGNNAQSVINKPNGTQLLHIVQNKGNACTNASQLPASQQNTFSGLSLVDGAIQQSGNQLLHIVNTANQKSSNAGQLLKRVNLLTNLTNVQGSNDQKMVQFVCKSADGKSIQLPHQRSMVLRLQPLDQPNVPTAPKQNDNQDHSSTSCTTNSVNEKESSPQEMKSRSLYEENYAKFVQNDAKFAQNGDSRPGPEKATSLPKFNQVFGKQVYQDKQNEMNNENLPENPDAPDENNAPLDQINDITNPPMLVRKTNPTQPSHVQPNLVQQIKQTISPMNIQTMHGGVIYTRQIPVNIGNGQTINLITVPSTELVDDSAQKQQTDIKFGNQDGDPPIIKIVPTNQPAGTPNGSPDDNNTSIRSTNNTNTQLNPQPVLTQMRIKLPMLSKAPHMVGGTRVVRPSFFQIQRNVIGGANQQVYQQLVLTAAPPLGQSIRLPTQVQKPKTPSETQSSPESQMSSSTLEQLREFDMVLEQVKERSTVQPGSSTSSSNSFTKLKSSPDTTDAPSPSKPTQESPTQVLYSVGNTQPLNMSNYVSRKSTITSTTSTSFVRSPDSTGTVESPSSSTHSHLPHTVTSDSCASSSCASEAAATTAVQPKPKKKKPKPSTSNSNPFNIKNTPKPSSQKPLEDEQTTQRILYILAEYKEQVENSPDKDKPAPRRRNNPAAPNAGSSKRKKSSSGSRRRDMSPVLGEDSCRTMGSEDSSCGTSLGECNECSETHSPEESPKKVVRRLTFEQETIVTQTRTITTSTTTTTVPQRNVIVTDGQAFAVRGATGKPATTVLMPANYLLPVSMVKGGQQIAIVTNRGPKLLVGAGDGGSGGALLFQRLIGPGGLKPVLARPGVRHIRLPTAALHNLQAFNIATPTVASVQPPDSTASPAPAPAPPDLVDTRAMSSPWPDRDAGEAKPDRGNSSPEGSEPWNLPSSSIADDYGYEEIVRTDNMDRTVLDAIPDRYSPDLEAQRIFDKMFDSDSKKSMYDSRCGYDIDASDDDKAYHQVVHRKDGRHTTRLSHVSAAALRHKYAILEHELRLQKSLSEECEDLGVDSPSASELFPEAELLFAPSPAHEQTIDHCHTPQPAIHTQGISQPDLDDQIATDQLLTHKERHDDLDINLDDVGEIVTVGEDGMTTIPLDHEEFARSHEEFARSHPNTTFHSEPEDGEVPPFTIAQGVKGRQITFHSRGVPVVMASQTTVISQATVEATGTQNPVKFSDIDNMINAMPSPHNSHISMPSVLKESNETLTKFDRLLNESRELNLSNATSAIVHSTGNGTQVIRRVQYERRDSRYLVEEDAMIAGDSKIDERRDIMDDTSSPERHPELFWDTQSRPERRRFDFSSDSDNKCCKSPYDEMNSDSSGIGAHMRLDSVIKAARPERRRSDGSSAEESHPPLRTYPPKRTHQHTHSHPHHDVDRSVTGKTRATDRCHDVKDESRRRASNRGVVKRGCHCCNGSTPPKPKKSRPKKSNDYPHN